MKITTILIAVLILTAMLMTGCGCRNSKPLDTMPSESTSAPTTMPTTEATTVPTTEATTPTQESTDATIDNGNGPLSTEDTGATGIPEDNPRSRRMPDMR